MTGFKHLFKVLRWRCTFSYRLIFVVTLYCILRVSAETEPSRNATFNSDTPQSTDEPEEGSVIDDVVSAQHEANIWLGIGGHLGGGGIGRNLPCFSLSRAHPLTRSCRGTCNIIFENDLIGFGWNFDGKSGHFICHFPGLYFITFSAISRAYTSFRLALMKNGHEIVAAYGTSSGYDTSGNSIIVPLQNGDKISLALMEGELYESSTSYRAYTTFSGFLVPLPNFDHDGGGGGGGGHWTPHPPHEKPHEKPDGGRPFPGFIGGGGVFSEIGPRILPVIDEEIEIIDNEKQGSQE